MPGQVMVRADAYVPFEPKTLAAQELRAQLRTGIGQLRAEHGEILWASLAGDLPRDADVENALFYNVGSRAFDAAAVTGVAFERDPVPPDSGVLYTYELADPRAWPRCWTIAAELARVTSRFDAVTPTLAGVWWSMRSQPEGIRPGTSRRGPGHSFSVDLKISGPASRVGPGLVKMLLDGVICGLQSESDLARAKAVAPRIAAALDQPIDRVVTALTDPLPSVLGARPRLVHAHGGGVKWSPDDDCCVAARILLTRAPHWSIDGVLHTVEADSSRFAGG